MWNNICVSFVFLALLEYALVNYAARADARYDILILMDSFESIFFLYSMKLVERRKSDPNPIYLL